MSRDSGSGQGSGGHGGSGGNNIGPQFPFYPLMGYQGAMYPPQSTPNWPPTWPTQGYPPPTWTNQATTAAPTSASAPDEYTVDTLRRIYSDDDGRVEIQRVKVRRHQEPGVTLSSVGPPGIAAGQSVISGGQSAITGGQSGIAAGQSGIGGQSGIAGGQSGISTGQVPVESMSVVPIASFPLNERRPPPRKHRRKNIPSNQPLGPYPWYPYIPYPYPYPYPYYLGGCVWPPYVPPGSNWSEGRTSRTSGTSSRLDSFPCTIDSQRLESRASQSSRDTRDTRDTRGTRELPNSPSPTSHGTPSLAPSDSVSVRGLKHHYDQRALMSPTPPPRTRSRTDFRGSEAKTQEWMLGLQRVLASDTDRLSAPSEVVIYKKIPPVRKRRKMRRDDSSDKGDMESISDMQSIVSDTTIDSTIDSLKLGSDLTYAFKKFERSVDAFQTEVSIDSIDPIHTPPSPSITLHSSGEITPTDRSISVPLASDIALLLAKTGELGGDGDLEIEEIESEAEEQKGRKEEYETGRHIKLEGMKDEKGERTRGEIEGKGGETSDRSEVSQNKSTEVEKEGNLKEREGNEVKSGPNTIHASPEHAQTSLTQKSSSNTIKAEPEHAQTSLTRKTSSNTIHTSPEHAETHLTQDSTQHTSQKQVISGSDAIETGPGHAGTQSQNSEKHILVENQSQTPAYPPQPLVSTTTTTSPTSSTPSSSTGSSENSVVSQIAVSVSSQNKIDDDKKGIDSQNRDGSTSSQNRIEEDRIDEDKNGINSQNRDGSASSQNRIDEDRVDDGKEGIRSQNRDVSAVSSQNRIDDDKNGIKNQTGDVEIDKHERENQKQFDKNENTKSELQRKEMDTHTHTDTHTQKVSVAQSASETMATKGATDLSPVSKVVGDLNAQLTKRTEGDMEVELEGVCSVQEGAKGVGSDMEGVRKGDMSEGARKTTENGKRTTENGKLIEGESKMEDEKMKGDRNTTENEKITTENKKLRTENGKLIEGESKREDGKSKGDEVDMEGVCEGGRESRASTSTSFSTCRASEPTVIVDTDSTDIHLPTTDTATTADEDEGDIECGKINGAIWVLQAPGDIPQITSTQDPRDAWRAEVSLWRARLVVSLCKGRGLDRQDWATFHLLVHHPLTLDFKLSLLHAPRLCSANAAMGPALVQMAALHLAQYGEVLLQAEDSRQQGWNAIQLSPSLPWAPVKGAVEILLNLGYQTQEDGSVLRYPRRGGPETSVVARLTLDLLVLGEELRLYLTSTHQYPQNISGLFMITAGAGSGAPMLPEGLPGSVGHSESLLGSVVHSESLSGHLGHSENLPESVPGSLRDQRPPSSAGSFATAASELQGRAESRAESRSSITDDDTETLQASVMGGLKRTDSEDEETLKEELPPKYPKEGGKFEKQEGDGLKYKEKTENDSKVTENDGQIENKEKIEDKGRMENSGGQTKEKGEMKNGQKIENGAQLRVNEQREGEKTKENIENIKNSDKTFVVADTNTKSVVMENVENKDSTKNIDRDKIENVDNKSSAKITDSDKMKSVEIKSSSKIVDSEKIESVFGSEKELESKTPQNPDTLCLSGNMSSLPDLVSSTALSKNRFSFSSTDTGDTITPRGTPTPPTPTWESPTGTLVAGDAYPTPTVGESKSLIPSTAPPSGVISPVEGKTQSLPPTVEESQSLIPTTATPTSIQPSTTVGEAQISSTAPPSGVISPVEGKTQSLSPTGVIQPSSTVGEAHMPSTATTAPPTGMPHKIYKSTRAPPIPTKTAPPKSSTYPVPTPRNTAKSKAKSHKTTPAPPTPQNTTPDSTPTPIAQPSTPKLTSEQTSTPKSTPDSTPSSIAQPTTPKSTPAQTPTPTAQPHTPKSTPAHTPTSIAQPTTPRSTPAQTPTPETGHDNPEEHIYEEIDVIRAQVNALRASSVPNDTPPPPLPPKQKMEPGETDSVGSAYPQVEWTSVSMPGSLRGGSTSARRKKRRAPMPPEFMPPDWKQETQNQSQNYESRKNERRNEYRRSLNPFYEEIDVVQEKVRELEEDNKRDNKEDNDDKGVEMRQKDDSGNPFVRKQVASGFVGKNPFYEDVELLKKQNAEKEMANKEKGETNKEETEANKKQEEPNKEQNEANKQEGTKKIQEVTSKEEEQSNKQGTASKEEDIASIIQARASKIQESKDQDTSSKFQETSKNIQDAVNKIRDAAKIEKETVTKTQDTENKETPKYIQDAVKIEKETVTKTQDTENKETSENIKDAVKIDKEMVNKTHDTENKIEDQLNRECGESQDDLVAVRPKRKAPRPPTKAEESETVTEQHKTAMGDLKTASQTNIAYLTGLHADKTPHTDKTGAHVDKTGLHADKTPHTDQTGPHIVQTVPNTDKIGPNKDKTEPHNDKTEPHIEKTVTQIDKAIEKSDREIQGPSKEEERQAVLNRGRHSLPHPKNPPPPPPPGSNTLPRAAGTQALSSTSSNSKTISNDSKSSNQNKSSDLNKSSISKTTLAKPGLDEIPYIDANEVRYAKAKKLSPNRQVHLDPSPQAYPGLHRIPFTDQPPQCAPPPPPGPPPDSPPETPHNSPPETPHSSPPPSPLMPLRPLPALLSPSLILTTMGRRDNDENDDVAPPIPPKIPELEVLPQSESELDLTLPKPVLKSGSLHGSQPESPVSQPVPPVSQPVPPVSQPVPPVSQPVPPVSQPVPPMSQPVPPVSQPEQPRPPVSAPRSPPLPPKSTHRQKSPGSPSLLPKNKPESNLLLTDSKSSQNPAGSPSLPPRKSTPTGSPSLPPKSAHIKTSLMDSTNLTESPALPPRSPKPTETPLLLTDSTAPHIKASNRQKTESPLMLTDSKAPHKQRTESPLLLTDSTAPHKQRTESPLLLTDSTAPHKQRTESPLMLTDSKAPHTLDPTVTQSKTAADKTLVGDSARLSTKSTRKPPLKPTVPSELHEPLAAQHSVQSSTSEDRYEIPDTSRAPPPQAFQPGAPRVATALTQGPQKGPETEERYEIPEVVKETPLKKGANGTTSPSAKPPCTIL